MNFDNQNPGFFFQGVGGGGGGGGELPYFSYFFLYKTY